MYKWMPVVASRCTVSNCVTACGPKSLVSSTASPCSPCLTLAEVRSTAFPPAWKTLFIWSGCLSPATRSAASGAIVEPKPPAHKVEVNASLVVGLFFSTSLGRPWINRVHRHSRGFSLEVHRLDLNPAMPQADGLRGSIVWAGRCAYETERYPFLEQECAFISQMVAAAVPCLEVPWSATAGEVPRGSRLSGAVAAKSAMARCN